MLLLRVGLLVAAVLAAAAGAVLWLDRPPGIEGSAGGGPAAGLSHDPVLVERGRVLALAGNCAGCHTSRGGASYAGGRAIATPFGIVYASNLTPDADTGLGAWGASEFWRALHHGVSRDGRRLVPAFPYTEYTRVTRGDSDALFAWLRTLEPVRQTNRPHRLEPGLGSPLALAAWRLAFFRPGEWRDDSAQSREWNRGGYLVNGLGHCAACHGSRNVLGGAGRAGAGFGGGLLPARSWYAPSLVKADEAGLGDWPEADVVALLATGAAPRGRANGPMAAVVRESTQHLAGADLHAMAVYLKSLPQQPAAARSAAPEADEAALAQRGALVYRDHCAACHGAAGEGGRTRDGRGVMPALAGNRLVTMEPAVNLVRAIIEGGFGAGTAADPRPFGMPPYAHRLGDAEIAAVATHLRRLGGATASAVSPQQVARWRGVDVD